MTFAALDKCLLSGFLFYFVGLVQSLNFYFKYFIEKTSPAGPDWIPRETFCAIWYHFYNFESVKNSHGGVLRSVKLKAKACSRQFDKARMVCFANWLWWFSYFTVTHRDVEAVLSFFQSAFVLNLLQLEATFDKFSRGFELLLLIFCNKTEFSCLANNSC